MSKLILPKSLKSTSKEEDQQHETSEQESAENKKSDKQKNKKEVKLKKKILPSQIGGYTCEDGIVARGFHKTNAVQKGEVIMTDRPRLPFGVFPIDYMLGGGIPLFGTVLAWGMDQSGKTTLLMQLLSQLKQFCFRCYRHALICKCKNKSPKLMKGFVVAPETDFDGAYAASIGADPDTYYVGYPETFEDAYAMTELALGADDCGFCAVDSIAAIDSILSKDDLEERDVAIQAGQATRFVRKIHKLMNGLLKYKEKPLFLFLITQARADMDAGKFGGFGPKIRPYAPYSIKHLVTYRLQCAKAAFSDSEKKAYAVEDEALPMVNKFRITVEKYKMATLERRALYLRSNVTNEEENLQRGRVIGEVKTALKMAKTLDLVESAGPKAQAIYKDDQAAFEKLKRSIILHAKKKHLR